MKKRTLALALALVLAAVAAPAGAAKVNVKYEAGDYSAWQTWAFAPNPKREAAAEAAGRGEIRETIREAIAEQLAAKGLERAEEGAAPDFLVGIDGSMQEVFDVEGVHRMITNRVVFVMEGDRHAYREGTLMIRVLEPDAEAPVWTAWTTEKIKGGNLEGQIKKAVRKLLRRFPPKP